MSSVPVFQASEIRRFEKKAQDTIALALILGWSIRWTNRKRVAVSLRSPGDGAKVLVVPTTNVNANRARSWLNQIATYTPMEDILRLINGDIDLMRAEPQIARVVAVTGTAVFQTMREHIAERNEDMQHLTQKVAEAVEPEPLAFKGADEADSLDQHFEVTEVSRTPYIVTRSSGDKGDITYESKAVEVITYSDGSTRYGCPFCDRVADTPRSISTHSGQAHRGLTTPDFLIEKREASKAQQPVTVTPTEGNSMSTTQSPSPASGASLRGVPLLTHYLRTAMLRSDQARDVVVDIISLDFETRARLAHVILMGKDSETMRAAAESRIAEVEAERDAALAEAERLRAWKTSFQDLLTSP